MTVLPHLRRSGAALATLAVLIGSAGCGTDADPVAAPTTTSAEPTATVPATTTPAPATTTAAPTTTRPAPPAGTGSATGGAPAGTGRCHTSELSLAFGPGGAGAGQRQGTVILQNKSARRCTLFGFGGLQVLDGARRALPVTLSRVGTPTLVRFGPRSNQIDKTISWTAVPSGAGCVQPVYVLVTPPDETDPLTGRWPYGAVCGGRIAGSPYGGR
jgi:hypothetical protein